MKLIEQTTSAEEALALIEKAGTTLTGDPLVSKGNIKNYGILLGNLLQAYETPTDQDSQIIEKDLERIRAVNQKDYEMARAISDPWMGVYANPDYRLFIFGEDNPAVLEQIGVTNSRGHAIVILGYKLDDGEMQPELIGRCDAAADMAKAFPEAILVCSGGATGRKNLARKTEAGLMKAYLAENCGIAASRIYIDERARTTSDNAINTLDILEKCDVQTMTIVTSSYHQCRGQILYSLMAELYRQQYGYSVEIVGNYCYRIESSTKYNSRMSSGFCQRKENGLCFVFPKPLLRVLRERDSIFPLSLTEPAPV